MIEIKQLQYLVVSAELKSFSRAAEVLYTTQPNVSKTIRSLEDELGFPVFTRQNRGISLTPKGRQVYEYACRAMDNVEELQALSKSAGAEELRISFNPSSWISARFSDFYNENQHQDVCYYVMTASVEEVIRRCARGADELGLVYVMEDQMPLFLYRLERGSLAYTELKKVRAVLYPGDLRKEKTDGPMKLVQCYEDEFSLNHFWGVKGGQAGRSNIEAAVVTNSDYVMNDLLRRTSLGNISGDYPDGKQQSRRQGISLSGTDAPVSFGYIKKKDEDLGKWSGRFISFLKNRISPDCEEEKGKGETENGS